MVDVERVRMVREAMAHGQLVEDLAKLQSELGFAASDTRAAGIGPDLG